MELQHRPGVPQVIAFWEMTVAIYMTRPMPSYCSKSSWSDSNRWHTNYKSAVLPTELQEHFICQLPILKKILTLFMKYVKNSVIDRTRTGTPFVSIMSGLPASLRHHALRSFPAVGTSLFPFGASGTCIYDQHPFCCALSSWATMTFGQINLCRGNWQDGARTHNPSVNSRLLYHWATCQYIKSSQFLSLRNGQTFSLLAKLRENVKAGLRTSI